MGDIMKWRNLFRCIALLFTATFLFACDGGGGDGISGGGSTGTVSVGLTDNSTDQYKAVYVTIKELQFNHCSLLNSVAVLEIGLF